MSFIRKQVRLHTDVYDAYRYLKKQERIERWCDEKPADIEGTAYSRVVWHFLIDSHPKTVTFYIMKCAQKAEYCTEVHAVVEKIEMAENGSEETMIHVQDTDSGEDPNEKVSAWLEAILEKLRVHYNRDWVISESDVLTDIFR